MLARRDIGTQIAPPDHSGSGCRVQISQTLPGEIPTWAQVDGQVHHADAGIGWSPGGSHFAQPKHPKSTLSQIRPAHRDPNCAPVGVGRSCLDDPHPQAGPATNYHHQHQFRRAVLSFPAATIGRLCNPLPCGGARPFLGQAVCDGADQFKPVHRSASLFATLRTKPPSTSRCVSGSLPIQGRSPCSDVRNMEQSLGTPHPSSEDSHVSRRVR